MKKNKLISYALIASMMFTCVCHTYAANVKAGTVQSTVTQEEGEPVAICSETPLLVQTSLPPTYRLPETTEPISPKGWAILRGNKAYNKETPGDVSFLIEERTQYGYRVYVDEVELFKDIDYYRVDGANNQLLTIKQSFLDNLSVGQHMVKVVYFDDVSEKTTYASLTVISQKVSVDIEPQYEVNETSCLSTKGAVYIPDNRGLYIPKSNNLWVDDVLINGTKMSILEWFEPNEERNYLYIFSSYLDSLQEGIYFVEVIYQGKVATEDVIPVVILPKGTGKIDVEQPKPVVTVYPTVAYPVKVSPKPTPTLQPTATISPKPTKEVTDINFSSDVSDIGSSIKQVYHIKYSNESQPIKLSNIKIRLYYNRAGAKSQEYHCDNAGLQLNEAPYYKSCTSDVTGKFQDGYFEIAFQGDEQFKDGEVSIDLRCNQSDWSAYQDVDIQKAELWYNGCLVQTKEFE